MSEWISVKDKLPEKDEQYLVYKVYKGPNFNEFGLQEVCGFATNLKDIDDEWFTKKRAGFYEYDSEVGFYEPAGITHWMPLPEPPKENEK